MLTVLLLLLLNLSFCLLMLQVTPSSRALDRSRSLHESISSARDCTSWSLLEEMAGSCNGAGASSRSGSRELGWSSRSVVRPCSHQMGLYSNTQYACITIKHEVNHATPRRPPRWCRPLPSRRRQNWWTMWRAGISRFARSSRPCHGQLLAQLRV